MRPPLISARGSRVPAEELRREIEEYFSSGARVAPGDTVVDVGANIGAFALAVAERCAGDVRLLCFEPAPATYEALATNFRSNEALRQTRHHLFQLGLGAPRDAGRVLSFYSFTRFETNNTFDLAGKRREFELFFEDRARRLTRRTGALGRVVERAVRTSLWRAGLWWILRLAMGLVVERARVSTLAETLSGAGITRIDLLKIDVEGLELDVLRGIDAATWPRIRQVVLETNDRDGRKDEIVQVLTRNGLDAIEVQPQRAIDNGLQSVIVCARRRSHPATSDRATATNAPTAADRSRARRT